MIHESRWCNDVEVGLCEVVTGFYVEVALSFPKSSPWGQENIWELPVAKGCEHDEILMLKSTLIRRKR
jgi:hypothetical protein